MNTTELKLENGQVIPLRFGIRHKIRYCEYVEELKAAGEDISSPTLDGIKSDARATRYNLLIACMIIGSAAECARVYEGNFDKVSLNEAEMWVMQAGDIEAEQIKKALRLNGIFSETGEPVEATPPKKQKSVGRKSKSSQ